jgi:hypothetical protein
MDRGARGQGRTDSEERDRVAASPGMKLTASDVELYARQIVIPEVGPRGQARLLATRAMAVGAREGVRRAALYLQRTGVAVDTPDLPLSSPRSVVPECVLVADLSSVDGQTRDLLLALSRPVVWYALDQLRLRSGITWPGDQLPSTPRLRRTASEARAECALHCIGACEAAARVIAVVLGFKVTPEREIDLG